MIQVHAAILLSENLIQYSSVVCVQHPFYCTNVHVHVHVQVRIAFNAHVDPLLSSVP